MATHNGRTEFIPWSKMSCRPCGTLSSKRTAIQDFTIIKYKPTSTHECLWPPTVALPTKRRNKGEARCGSNDSDNYLSPPSKSQKANRKSAPSCPRPGPGRDNSRTASGRSGNNDTEIADAQAIMEELDADADDESRDERGTSFNVYHLFFRTLLTVQRGLWHFRHRLL